MKLGLGIDTGGTYTDAVMYDFESGQIQASAKALTTREDLSVGILGAMDALPPELLQQAQVIALSTTLATNACVEEKGGKAELIFFGGDKRVIDRYGQAYGLPPADDIYIQECRTTFDGTVEQEPDWERFCRHIEESSGHLDGVGILEMNAMKNGAVIEKKAKALFEQRCDIPVVCGHELFSELNCLQRGASTLLNAGLFPIIREFLEAIKLALAQRHIQAPLVIVRSDGSLMSEEFASLRPVETLLCGPAASTLGGTHLADSPNCIVVDMGGTTTDIALVKDGKPVTVVDGVSIGKWKTYVDGLYIKTVGLGGDSAVHIRDGKLILEEYRIVPLCVAAQQHPAMLEDLREIAAAKRVHSRPLYEHYILVRDIAEDSRYTQEEKVLCSALRDRPLSLAKAAQAVGRDIYTLRVSRLLKDGVIQLCGLTPTDAMHLCGDFCQYDTEASRLGAEFAAFNLGISIPELCEQIYREIQRKLYLHIAKALLENQRPHFMKNGISEDTEAFLNESFEAAYTGAAAPLLSLRLCTQYTLVGIGAPIRVFIEKVAALLGTNCVIPEHYEVANALGAVIGNVSASYSVEIKPYTTPEGCQVLMVYGPQENRAFEELEDAEAFARMLAGEAAQEEARRRGAHGEVAVHYTVRQNEGEARDGMVYFGTTVTAQAVASGGF